MPVDKIIQILLLFLSMWGYVQLLSSKIKPEFSIGVTFSFIGSVIFLAGVAGKLYPAVRLIIVLGIICLVISLFMRVSIKKLITPGTVFFFVMLCVFTYLLFGAYFVEQDNFTHWAFVGKILIQHNRFPLSGDANIWFPSYPLGSQSFIYFFCKALGADSEWFQMLAQAMLMTGMGCAMFAFAKNVKGWLLAAVYVVLMLCGNIGFNELLVDTLLAMIGFGGIAFCVYYRNELKSKIWYTIPYMVFLMAVKNSGLFFAAVMIVYCLVYVIKNKDGFAAVAKLAVCSATPFIALKIWQTHVKNEFTNGLLAKHTMSISNFEKIFGDKTAEDVSVILHKFAAEIFSFSNPVLYILVFVAVILLVNRFVLKEKDSFLNGSALFAFIVYVTYQIGQLGMFMFTMPTNEALVLACYDRYTDTVMIVVYGIVCCALLNSRFFESSASKLKIWALICCIGAVFAAESFGPHTGYYSRQHIPEDRNRAINNKLIEEYNIPLNSGYIIIFDDECEEWKKETYFYEAKYIFGNNVKVRYLREVKADETIFYKYPWVIMYHQTEPIVEYLESRYGPDLPRVFYTPNYPPVEQ